MNNEEIEFYKKLKTHIRHHVQAQQEELQRALTFDEYDHVVKVVIDTTNSLANTNYDCKSEAAERELELIKLEIFSDFMTHQPEGITILNNYDHHRDWYKEALPNIDNYYWDLYRWHLKETQGFSPKVIHNLKDITVNGIMELLGDPKSDEGFQRKGLVVGDVQSGKTANYIGLITSAADAGYKVIILLAGIIEKLRSQTQKRIDEGFIGFVNEGENLVGVGKNVQYDGTKRPISFTNQYHDFSAKSVNTTALNLNISSNPYIFVIKKNMSALENLRKTLLLHNAQVNGKIKFPMILIDDEADNASINTNNTLKGDEPTKINGKIRALLNIFEKSNYVGFTATPFANVFIDPDSISEMYGADLFPSDFIYVIEPPSNYFGPKKIFVDERGVYTRIIDDEDEYIFDHTHNKYWDGESLFPSLTDAIYAFMITNVIRDLEEGELRESAKSMLVNMSRFIDVQKRIKEIIKDIVQETLEECSNYGSAPAYMRDNKPRISRIKEIYEEEYYDYFSWDKIIKGIYKHNANLSVVVVNSGKDSDKLDYGNKKLKVITIGGLALSRGLTLDGLAISYLYRNTATFDVLMQMGRWFGYRDKPTDYEKLCRVWLTDKTEEYFYDIARSTELLKNDIRMMEIEKRTPLNFGVRVRMYSSELSITSSNKMRMARMKKVRTGYHGEAPETPFVASSKRINEENFKIISEFLDEIRDKCTTNDKKYLYKNVNPNHVIDVLKKVKVSNENTYNYFDPQKIVEFMTKTNYPNVDVAIINGDGPIAKIGEYVVINSIVRTSDSVGANGSVIRIGGTKRRLGSPSDYLLGFEGSKEIIRKANNTKACLVPGRNPLFVIYPIKVNKAKNGANFDVDYQLDNGGGLVLPIIGLGIGFPAIEGQENTPVEMYAMNVKVNYDELYGKEEIYAEDE